jgi:hypothetical protein
MGIVSYVSDYIVEWLTYMIIIEVCISLVLIVYLLFKIYRTLAEFSMIPSDKTDLTAGTKCTVGTGLSKYELSPKKYWTKIGIPKFMVVVIAVLVPFWFLLKFVPDLVFLISTGCLP